MLDWQWPLFALILPLPLLLRMCLKNHVTQQYTIRVPFFSEASQSDKSQAASASLHTSIKNHALKALALLLWLALVAAAARPIWYGEPLSVTTKGRDLLLALDVSDSMRIEDMIENGNSTTRLETIKRVAGHFIERREGDRIGLLIFGQNSYLQSPLTYDRRSVSIQLQEAQPGFAGSSTAIGDAMGMAINILRDRPTKGRVLILLTDGANTAGSDPQRAMDIAAEAGIRIHTIGVGASSLAINDGSGRDRVIDPSKDLDESTLSEIALKTGGQYFRAKDPAALEQIYAQIDTLEPIPQKSTRRPQRSLYHWPLLVALICSLVLLLARTKQTQQ